MAAASYTTDLATHTDCSATTGFAEATGFTAGSGSGEVDTDLAIYGTSCISEAQRKSGKGSLIYTGTARTLPTNGVFLIWFKFFAPNALLTKTNGGMQVFIGNSSSVFNQYYINGSDTYPYGGWVNYVADPTVTATTSTGNPSAPWEATGIGVDLSTGISKGNSFTIDHIRWGRGEAIITDGDLANGYANFDALAVVNDNPTTGRWGLFQDVGGSYLWKGLMTLGESGTPVDFRDSNIVISIDNTEFVAPAFNRIEVNDATSNIEWISVNISSLGTVSKGEFEAIADATILHQACTFTDMSTFIYQSNSDIDLTTFRRCGQVTQGSAVFTDNLFDESIATVALVANSLNNVTGNTFNSDGTGHAVNLGNITTTQALTWDNFESGYVTGTTGSPVTTGTSGNETLLCNVSTGEVLTINVADGASVPSVKNDGSGTVNVVAGQYDFIISGLEINTEVTILTAGTQTELFHVENTSVSDGDGKYKVTYTHGGGETVDILIHHIYYVPDISNIYNLTLASAAGSAKVQMFLDPYYNGSQ